MYWGRLPNQIHYDIQTMFSVLNFFFSCFVIALYFCCFLFSFDCLRFVCYGWFNRKINLLQFVLLCIWLDCLFKTSTAIDRELTRECLVSFIKNINIHAQCILYTLAGWYFFLRLVFYFIWTAIICSAHSFDDYSHWNYM